MSVKVNHSLNIEERGMVISPVNTAYQPVSKTRPVSWENVTKRAANVKANDNPAVEITRSVPAPQFKGQFIDLLS